MPAAAYDPNILAETGKNQAPCETQAPQDSPFHTAAPKLAAAGFAFLQVAYGGKLPARANKVRHPWQPDEEFAWIARRPGLPYPECGDPVYRPLDGWQNVTAETAVERLSDNLRNPYPHNIGVLLNDGLVCVDVDTDHPGIVDAVEDWARSLGGDYVAKVGGKGVSVFVRLEDPDLHLPGKLHVGDHLIDILASGRQTIVPPSMHTSGKRYRWVGDVALEDSSLDDLPSLNETAWQALLDALGVHGDLAGKGSALGSGQSYEKDGFSKYLEDLATESFDHMARWMRPLELARIQRVGNGFRAVNTTRKSSTNRPTAQRTQWLEISPGRVVDKATGVYGIAKLYQAKFGVSYNEAENMLFELFQDEIDEEFPPWEPAPRPQPDPDTPKPIDKSAKPGMQRHKEGKHARLNDSLQAGTEVFEAINKQFLKAVRKWWAAKGEVRKANKKIRESNEAFDIGPKQELLAHPEPPRRVVNGSAGLGKSQNAYMLATELLKITGNRSEPGRILWRIPDHGLARQAVKELSGYLKAEGFNPDEIIGHYKGPDQLVDPESDDSTFMCPRKLERAELTIAGGSGNDLCGDGATGFCPHAARWIPDEFLGKPEDEIPEFKREAPVCGYHKQNCAGKRIVIVAGDASIENLPSGTYRLDDGKRTFYGEFDLVVIDEVTPTSFIDTRKGVNVESLKTDWADELKRNPDYAASLVTAEGVERAPSAMVEDFCNTVVKLQGWLKDAEALDKLTYAKLKEDWPVVEGEIPAEAFGIESTATVSADTLTRAERFSWRLTWAINKGDGLHRADVDVIKKKFGKQRKINQALRSIRSIIAGIRQARERSKSDDQRVAEIQVLSEPGKEEDEIRIMSSTWLFKDVDWDRIGHVPALILDASAEPLLLERRFPGIDEVKITVGDGRGVTRLQCFDSWFSYSKFVEGSGYEAGSSADELDKRNQKKRQRCRDHAALMSVLTMVNGEQARWVGPKRVEEEILAHGMPEGSTMHFNATRGLNHFKGCASLVVLSRPSIRRNVAERYAGMLSDRDIDEIENTKEMKPHMYETERRVYEKRNGGRNGYIGEYHPDPVVEAVRRSTSVGEPYQAAKRSRDIWIDEDQQHTQIILSATDVGVVDGTFTREQYQAAASWVGALLGAGIWITGKGGLMDARIRALGSIKRLTGVDVGKMTAEGIDDATQNNPEIKALVAAANEASRNGGSFKILGHVNVDMSDWRTVKVKAEGGSWVNIALHSSHFERGGYELLNTLSELFPDYTLKTSKGILGKKSREWALRGLSDCSNEEKRATSQNDQKTAQKPWFLKRVLLLEGSRFCSSKTVLTRENSFSGEWTPATPRDEVVRSSFFEHNLISTSPAHMAFKGVGESNEQAKRAINRFLDAWAPQLPDAIKVTYTAALGRQKVTADAYVIAESEAEAREKVLKAFPTATFGNEKKPAQKPQKRVVRGSKVEDGKTIKVWPTDAERAVEAGLWGDIDAATAGLNEASIPKNLTDRVTVRTDTGEFAVWVDKNTCIPALREIWPSAELV
ncbi:bifunctional DNA primase/polymerase [Roseibium alexandrii]|nr:bifunctional DNA primase/polymerase [Roseibium alexandrii]